ncbi:MAG: DUF4340 domain-containing protein [Rhodothermia bacterium]
MDQKRILLLVATLVVLLLAAWLSGYFGGTSSTVETPDLTLAADRISSITIRKWSEKIVAVRSSDGAWRLEMPVVADVDTTTRAALINSLEDIRIESLVSSRADRHEKFQVDSAQATYLRLDGDGSVEFYVGKTGPDFQSRYIRLGDDERVFLATGIPAIEPNLDRWKDKLLWSYPKGSVATVSVRTPESTFRLVHPTTGWTLEQDGASSQADSAKVDRYLNRLATVKADGFLLEVNREAVFDSASYSVEIQWIDGSGSQLRMTKREADAAAVVDGSNDVVKFFSYRVATFAPEPAALLPD